MKVVKDVWSATGLWQRHCFQMRDGLIVHEIAYELFRELGSVTAHDDIPEDAVWHIAPEMPESN